MFTFGAGGAQASRGHCVWRCPSLLSPLGVSELPESQCPLAGGAPGLVEDRGVELRATASSFGHCLS